jgi:oligopeptide/dipeptide ABC transporter ATP-binding protein
MAGLLEVWNLVKHFPIGHGRSVKAVNDVSLHVDRGEAVALVGESGSGKTTLGRCVLGLIEPTSGEILFGGADVAQLFGGGLRSFRRRVQMVFQEPHDSLNPRMRIGRIIEEPLRLCDDMGPGQRMARVKEVLTMVRLDASAADKYAHEFSAGEHQRIAIARAIVTEPELVVLDEPTSALDVSVRADILDLLSDLQKRLRFSYLFISHDLTAVRRVCDRVVVMYLGKVVETAKTDEIFERPFHPYSRALLSSVLYPDPKKVLPRFVLTGEIPSPIDLPSGCHLHQRCPWVVEACKAICPPLDVLTPGRAAACIRAAEMNGVPTTATISESPPQP